MSGFRYWEQVDAIKALKRSGQGEAALALLLRCIEEIEKARCPPPPWHYEQAAILLKKAGDVAAEVSILSRYIDACRQNGEPPVADVVNRLSKAKERLVP